ncbi:UBX domain-containing protein 6 [Thelohanellus kitauei]|uniref:UBX domain-containing protein 6 n=1 Tax=Thelohanellus kitauei TaxID=669202 RepID=A0A0C2IQT4_THEKT|nr:UBX domain-containing protein 6 [Thelohanellus kitauei]
MEPEDKNKPQSDPANDEPTAADDAAVEQSTTDVKAPQSGKLDAKPTVQPFESNLTTTSVKIQYDSDMLVQFISDRLWSLKKSRENIFERFSNNIKVLFSKKFQEPPQTLSTAFMSYSCPICNYEASGVKSWKHFEKCMLDRLKTDPIDYAVPCLVSLNPPEQTELCKTILIKYLKNLTSYPLETTFRNLRVKSELFYECVFPIIGGLSIFEVSGFKSVVHVVDNLPEMYLELPLNIDAQPAKLVLHWLEIAKPLRPMIKRNTKIVTLSDDEKLKYFEPSQNEEVQEGTGSTTSATGWIDFSQMDHRMTRIYFDIAPNKGVEASFIVTETSNDLYSFIEPIFHFGKRELVLLKIGKHFVEHLDNTKLNKDSQTLLDLNLFPKTILYVKWNTTDAVDDDKIGIKCLLYNDI